MAVVGTSTARERLCIPATSMQLTLSDLSTVQVSTCIYITRERNNHTDSVNFLTKQPSDNTIILWRKIGGLYGHPEPGWHFIRGWKCYFPLALCLNGVSKSIATGGLYYGIEDRMVEVFKTHPLNESYRI